MHVLVLGGGVVGVASNPGAPLKVAARKPEVDFRCIGS